MALRVGVLGAGAIGGYLGVRLSASGASVVLVGRRSLIDRRERLHAVGLDGTVVHPDPTLEVAEDPRALSDADVVLVTVKSRDTADAGRVLAEHASQDATVVSFQNGLANAPTLREPLGSRVVAGMVSFNVRREDEGARLRQLTRGPLVAGPGQGLHAGRVHALAELLEAGGLPLQLHDAIGDVLAGKLLLNLNNGICAATGLPILDSLRTSDARWCLSRCMLEGLAVLRAAGYRPATVLGLPPSIIARALRLPNAILLRVAGRLVSADPDARSSTLQDLDAGKPTEIDELNGAIVALAREHRLKAPGNEVVTEIVHALEGSPTPLRFVSAAELRRRIAQREARAARDDA
ncbi:2-dehydropantoate 2-reductase [Paraliomyxa miuraensis]|uniref:2-dehydropantoate 2-reductase n=1 Tax=Paraliomyxa miuraensis TaxID=376150 RepID=UPI00224C928F|nr:2-dehydropantoate 2-reductase [Paraliomyxa miuraensis]MCX4247488.1 2-dehydropantoate 2-reductase [Paraliomyxa miuraensis]